MLQTTLYTAKGEIVTDVLVPPFIPEAEVIVWGSRVFVWKADKRRYEEGMAFWAATT